jgi:hypothetical protein
MDKRQFEKRLLDIILLLVALIIFNIAIALSAPLMSLGDWHIPIVRNISWIGKLIFGIIIYRLTNQRKTVALSIGFLSIMLPIFGGLFYLLTLTITKTDK